MRRMLAVGTVLAGALALGSGGGARADEPGVDREDPGEITEETAHSHRFSAIRAMQSPFLAPQLRNASEMEWTR